MIQRLRKRSVRELRDRLRQRSAVALERLNLVPSSREPSPASFPKLLEPGLVPGEFGLAADIVNCCRAAIPGLADPARAAAAVVGHWPDDAEAIVERANGIVLGRFDLLGYPELQFGTPPDWQLDPVSGRRAPMRHWSTIPYLDAGLVGDHKVTWELNRHQYLVTLAQAWLITGNEQFPATIATHLEAWMDANPPKRGINWASSLEVGFRSIAWIWTLALAGNALPPVLVQRAAGMLHVHARHLESHLSTWFSPNTHLTGEALALVYLGSALPMFRRSERWRERGLRILEEETRRQILPDGVYFEQATYYHRYTTDFYLHLALLLSGQEPGRPHWLDALLAHLLDYLVAIVRPDGTWPLIGDEDGGRLLCLKSRSANDFGDTLAVGAVLLGRREYCLPGSRAPAELAWLFGPAGGEHWEVLGTSPPPAFAIFPKGGYAVLRGAERDWLLMEAGPHGGLAGGHAHSDGLALELAAGGTTVLQDAGTFTYVTEPALRDQFRSGAFHSTVTVGGESASVPAGPFRWAHRGEASFEGWKSTERFDFIAGRQQGFRQLGTGVIHRRQIFWLRQWRCWVVRDCLDGVSAGFDAHFHAAPGIVIAMRRQSALFRGADANLLRLDALAESCDLAVTDSWHSAVYGCREPAQALVVNVKRGTELVTLLRAGPSHLTYARDVTGTTVTLERDGNHVEILASASGWQLDGKALNAFGD